jgi:hypothetical protein
METSQKTREFSPKMAAWRSEIFFFYIGQENRKKSVHCVIYFKVQLHECTYQHNGDSQLYRTCHYRCFHSQKYGRETRRFESPQCCHISSCQRSSMCHLLLAKMYL